MNLLKAKFNFTLFILVFLFTGTSSIYANPDNVIVLTNKEGSYSENFNSSFNANIAPGSVISLEGIEYHIGEKLGHGNSHMIYELVDQPSKVIRIPISTKFSYSRLNLEFVEGMEAVSKFNIPTVKVFHASNSHLVVERLVNPLSLEELLEGAEFEHKKIIDTSMQALEEFLIKMGNVSGTGDGTQILYSQPTFENPIGEWVLADILRNKSIYPIEGYVSHADHKLDNHVLFEFLYKLKLMSPSISYQEGDARVAYNENTYLELKSKFEKLYYAVANVRGASEQEVKDFLLENFKMKQYQDYGSKKSNLKRFGKKPVERYYDALFDINLDKEQLEPSEVRFVNKKLINAFKRASKQPMIERNSRAITTSLFWLQQFELSEAEWKKLVSPINKLIPLIEVNSVQYKNLVKLLVANKKVVESIGGIWKSNHPEFFKSEYLQGFKFEAKEPTSRLGGVLQCFKVFQ